MLCNFAGGLFVENIWVGRLYFGGHAKAFRFVLVGDNEAIDIGTLFQQFFVFANDTLVQVEEEREEFSVAIESSSRWLLDYTDSYPLLRKVDSNQVTFLGARIYEILLALLWREVVVTQTREGVRVRVKQRHDRIPLVYLSSDGAMDRETRLTLCLQSGRCVFYRKWRCTRGDTQAALLALKELGADEEYKVEPCRVVFYSEKPP